MEHKSFRSIGPMVDHGAPPRIMIGAIELKDPYPSQKLPDCQMEQAVAKDR